MSAVVNAGVIEAILRLRDEWTPVLGRVAAGSKQMGSTLTGVGQAIMPLSLMLTGVGLAGVKMATDLNASMANIQTMIPNGTARIAELKAEVQELAVETGKSTQDLAEGLYEVIGGFGDTADSAAILAINAKAAAAGVADTRDSIALTSAVTKAYGEVNKETVQRAADLAFQAVNLGQTSFPQLAAAIGSVTPLAAELKVTQEELFGVMATFTGVTGGAAEVSTQLRGVLAALMAPTESMAGLMRGLGYESGQAMMQGLGLQGTINAIVTQAKSSNQPLKDYMGSIEGQTLALAAAGGQSQTFTEKLAAMKDAAGAADNAFREQSQGVNKAGFEWNQLRREIEVAMQQLGDELIPILVDVGKNLKPIFDWVVGLIREFKELPDPVKNSAVALGMIAAISAPTLVAIGGGLTMIAGGLAAVGLAGPAAATGADAAAAGVGRLTTAMKVFQSATVVGAVLMSLYALKIAYDESGDSAARLARMQQGINNKNGRSSASEVADQVSAAATGLVNQRREALLALVPALTSAQDALAAFDEWDKKNTDEKAERTKILTEEQKKFAAAVLDQKNQIMGVIPVTREWRAAMEALGRDWKAERWNLPGVSMTQTFQEAERSLWEMLQTLDRLKPKWVDAKSFTQSIEEAEESLRRIAALPAPKLWGDAKSFTVDPREAEEGFARLEQALIDLGLESGTQAGVSFEQGFATAISQIGPNIVRAIQGGGNPLHAAVGGLAVDLGNLFAEQFSDSVEAQSGPIAGAMAGGVITAWMGLATHFISDLMRPSYTAIEQLAMRAEMSIEEVTAKLRSMGDVGADVLARIDSANQGLVRGLRERFEGMRDGMDLVDMLGQFQTQEELQKIADQWKGVYESMLASGSYTAATLAEAWKKYQEAVEAAIGAVDAEDTRPEGARGFPTRAQLEAAAKAAGDAYAYMRDSGLYTSDVLEQAWERWQDALDDSGDTAVKALREIDAEMKSLQASIADEAPEEVRGEIEKQNRARLAALEEERAKVLEGIEAKTTAEEAAAVTAAAAAKDAYNRAIQGALDLDAYLRDLFSDGYRIPVTIGAELRGGGVPYAGAFAKGGSFETDGPAYFLAGEAGRERVTVTPLTGGRGPSYGGGAANVSVTFTGPISVRDDSDIDAISDRVIQGLIDRGVVA